MAKLTGIVIKDRYAAQVKTNSFYEMIAYEQTIGIEYLTENPEIVYYIDKRTGHLSAKETSLLW